MYRVKIVVFLAVLFVSGCSTRSISETGYSQNDSPNQRYSVSRQTPELRELDVLGIDKSVEITEDSIESALSKSSKIEIPKNSSVLVIQSGSIFPDGESMMALGSFWNVNQLSGVASDYEVRSLNKTLRYAAATSGSKHIIVYWGIVETAEKSLATKSVSWLPVVGWSLPDERIEMRIRLKFAVIDVVTGQWKMLQPPAIGAEFLSTFVNREGKDQEKVIELKKAVYEIAAKFLFEKVGS